VVRNNGRTPKQYDITSSAVLRKTCFIDGFIAANVRFGAPCAD
jgi:hypothetical protein